MSVALAVSSRENSSTPELAGPPLPNSEAVDVDGGWENGQGPGLDPERFGVNGVPLATVKPTLGATRVRRWAVSGKSGGCQSV